MTPDDFDPRLGPALDGPSALCYGGESVVDVARMLIGWAKKVDALEVKAALLDGEFAGGADRSPSSV